MALFLLIAEFCPTSSELAENTSVCPEQKRDKSGLYFTTVNQVTVAENCLTVDFGVQIPKYITILNGKKTEPIKQISAISYVVSTLDKNRLQVIYILL